MAQILKQSAAVDVLIGPFVDKTDAATAETGESPTVKLSKNGQALAAKNDVTTPLHDADGYYNCELDATDTNTVGNLVLTVAASANALPVRHEYQVVEEAIYDALFGTSAAGFDANGRVDVGSWLGTAAATPTVAGVPEVDVTHLGGTAQSAADLKDFADAGYDPATSQVEGVKLVDATTTNTDMVSEPPTAAAIADQVWDEAIAGHAGAGSAGNLVERLDIIAAGGGGELTAGRAANLDNADAAVSTRATPADVNAQVVDVMTVDTIALPGQTAPPGAPTFAQAVGWLYKVLRNRKRQTATQWELMADNETTVDAKATVADDGTTAIKQEIVSGP